MARQVLELSIALSDNVRTQPIIEGRVAPEGIRLVPTAVHPSEMFWRQLKFQEFDVSEMSISSYTIATSQGPTPWVALPIYTMRHFFHTGIMVRTDRGINKPADLKGKRVNAGPSGSGQRAMFEDVMAAHDFTAKDFAQLSDLRSGEQAKALCERKIDAAVVVLAHTNGAIHEMAAACELALVEISGAPLERLLQDRPYYAPLVVPSGLYERLPAQDSRSFGLKATLVAPAQLGDYAVYQILRAVFDNFDEFRSLHPAFAGLDARAMARDGNSAPLHPGAERYFNEKGLR